MLLINSDKITEKVLFLGTVFEQNCKLGTPNLRVLLKWAKRGKFFVKYGFLAVAAPLSTFVIYPILVYCQTGEKLLILPMMFPGVDHTTLAGYTITNSLHLAGCILAIFGTVGADFMLVLLVVHMWPLCEVFENMVNELNATLRTVEYRSTIELRRFFRNITMCHVEICEYLQVGGYWEVMLT